MTDKERDKDDVEQPIIPDEANKDAKNGEIVADPPPVEQGDRAA